jgi:pimeloyl-ACP methyl ester carboxylesterase
MIEAILAGAAGLVAAPIVGGLAYRKVRQRRIAKTLAIETPNGIVEGRYVRIGGVDQWIQIRGEDRDNPVLLVVHGGPGSPYAIFTPLLRSWEKHFIVVQWGRRGAGRTIARNGKAGSGEMTFDSMVADGIEVAEFLRLYLSKDKVILMAGSMGTLVGLPMAKWRPDLFSAYVGTDFYVDMADNEALGYRLTLGRVRAADNAKGIAALEKIGPDPSRWDVRAWGVKMAWSMRTDPVTPGLDMKLVLPLTLTSPTYTLRDVFQVATGFEYSKAEMFE